jgi:phosphotransferase system HPr (HPr) family protein
VWSRCAANHKPLVRSTESHQREQAVRAHPPATLRHASMGWKRLPFPRRNFRQACHSSSYEGISETLRDLCGVLSGEERCPASIAGSASLRMPGKQRRPFANRLSRDGRLLKEDKKCFCGNSSHQHESAFRAAALNCMRKEVEIVNKLGLHARPAALFVRCVIRFKSKLTICKGDENFSAASILEVLSADLDCGAPCRPRGDRAR